MRAYAALFITIVFAAGCAATGGLPGTPVAGGGAAAALHPAAVPVVAGCQVFPAPGASPSGNDWWNVDVSNYPVDPNSDRYIAAYGGNLHPDFGRNHSYGIPFNIVPANQKKVKVTFDYNDQSDKGPYPIPPNAEIEGGPNSHGDRHVLVLQQETCTLYEMWNSHPVNGGQSWHAGSGAVFHLTGPKANTLRPNGWTSADAAGLPIFPALIKCAEVQAGEIDHALRVTFDTSQRGYIHPATHFASSSSNPKYAPMGLRFRLKASYDISHFNRVSKIILTAMKKYGLFMADNGSNWYFQGQGGKESSCWNDNQLDQLKGVPGSAFEVVKTGPILH